MRFMGGPTIFRPWLIVASFGNILKSRYDYSEYFCTDLRGIQASTSCSTGSLLICQGKGSMG